MKIKLLILSHGQFIRTGFSFLPAIFFTILFITACKGKQQTEAARYADVKKSLTYKTYQASSGALIKTSVVAYNLSVPDSLEMNEPMLHLFLAYNWAVVNKPTFALAETNFIEEKYPGDTSIAKVIPLIRAITLYESGLPIMAKAASEKGMKYMGLSPNATEDRQKVLLFHLLMASVCIKEKQFDAAEFHINGFALVANTPWLSTLVSGMNDIKKKDLKSGLQKIKRVSQDESVPMELRIELKSAIEQVEAKGGDVDAMLFWPKLMGSLIMDQLSKSTDRYTSSVITTVQKITSTLKDKIPSF